MTRRVVTLALVAALAGCAPVGPDYVRPDVHVPPAYGEPNAAAPAPALTPLPVDWWKLYHDPVLDGLVATGLAEGTDVRLAAARVEEAAAALREAGALLLPEIDATGSASRSGASSQTGAIRAGGIGVLNNFALGVSTAYEIDFWGRLRRLQEAAQAQYAASDFGREVVTLTLVAAIARTYFNVGALDTQIVLSQQTQKVVEDSLAITRRRADAGVASDLDVYQAESTRAQLAAQIKDLRRLRAVTVHQLGVLVGRPALTVERTDVMTLPAPPLPPAGLPSALLERRPDVRQAEATLVAANAAIGVARAQQLPTISLTGTLGLQSDNLAHLLTGGASVWSIGVGFLGPIIDWGKYQARTDAAEARAKQAAVRYEQSVQTAFREVSDALSNVAIAAEAERDLRALVDAANNSLRLATQRYEAGYSGYLDVLIAQRTLNDAQLALVRNRQSFLAYTVDLMSSLGGGWSAGAS
ncbi:MAG: efflux transporter outer membrane subunit [Burkholderiales bacterium]